MGKQKHIFERMQAGELIRHSDAGYADFFEIVSQSIKLCAELNSAPGDLNQIRTMLGKITGKEIDESTILFPPFHTNFGRFITLGKRVFINHACSFLDIGGITIEDDVMIGPRVNLTSENHPTNPADRKTVIPKPILIRKNAWIGAAATILPGVTIGENAIVAAGAVVSKDVPPNTIVGGVPARVIKSI